MDIAFRIIYAFVIPPCLFFAANFYRYKREELKFKELWISIILFSITATISTLQFIFPEIIPVLDRDRQALLSGEVWRLITPVFIQPLGIWHCLINAMFFVCFVPIAERLYGRSLWLIYFGSCIVGQIVNMYWETTPGGLQSSKGGSSSSLFGVAGSLMIYILLNQKVFPRGYVLIPMAVLTASCILLFYEDGHAPAMLFGALLGLLLRGRSRQIAPYPQVKSAS